MNRKTILLFFLAICVSCKEPVKSKHDGINNINSDQVRNTDAITSPVNHKEIILKADEFLNQRPVPITNFSNERSAGSINDFYSEGDYWWENPDDPEGPYIRRDGLSNPDNFVQHRQAMRNLNLWVSTLTAAYKISKDRKYAQHALIHLEAFFLDHNTAMNPSLLYAQAIKGRVTGRGIGIIDTIHLIEVAQSIRVLAELDFLAGEKLIGLKNWFNQYADWLTTHPYGLDEKDHGNNHSTWWAAQVASFARLADREDLINIARSQFKKLLLTQMDEDGRFPEELSRTKPYNYTLFNLEGFTILSLIASTKEDNLWHYEKEHKSLLKGWKFMEPFIKDKSSWIKPPDVQYFDELPVQSAGFLFAANAYENESFLETWNSIDKVPESMEIKRNHPILHHILWTENIM